MENVFEKNISKLMKAKGNNDQPEKMFVDKLINDAMDVLKTQNHKKILNLRRSIMKMNVKITAVAAGILVITAVIIMEKTGVFATGKPVKAKQTSDIKGNGMGPVKNKPNAADMAPIQIELPPAVEGATPINLPPDIENLEKKRGKPREPFYAPVGTINLALGKPVSSSDSFPIVGTVRQITDGDKKGTDGSWVELGPFEQYVTIDLQEKCNIYAIAVWHYHKQPRIYFDIAVQVSDDPDFVTNVKTVFNNDIDNSLGHGAGKDMNYIETNSGKLIDAKGIQGRYVRLYSNGNHKNDMNNYIEVEVYGKPLNSN